MSCGCQNSSSNCNGCTPCNCCPPAPPPCPAPPCQDPEPCDIALDSKCVIYTGGDLECIGIDAGTPPIIKLDQVLETLDAAICQAGIGATFVEDTDCIVTTGVGSFADPLVINPVISDAPGNALECTEDGLYVPTPIIPAIITADNGLTKTLNNIQLGGALITPTTVTTDVTNTLSITGLSTDNTPDFILTETTPGVVKKIATSTLTSSILSNVTADNGLTKTGNNIQLGGPLIQDTVVDLDTFDLSLLDVTTDTGVIIKPGAADPLDYNVDTTKVRGKFEVNDRSWFQGNVGVGVVSSDTTGGTDGGTKLQVIKLSNLGTSNTGRYFGFNSILGLRDGTETTFQNYISSVATLDVIFNTPKTLLPSSGYVGMSAGLNFGSKANVTGEAISAYSTGFSFGAAAVGDPTGGLEKLIGYRVVGPRANVANGGWNETIGTFVGVQIDNARANMNGGINGDITNSWGVRQEGPLDRNYFVGNTGIGVNPYPASDTDTPVNTNNAKLFVGRTSGFRPSSLTTASDHILTFDAASGAESPNIIAGLTGRINPAPTANVTMAGGSRIAAVYGYMQYTGTFDITNGLRNGLTGVFGQCSFSSGGTASPTGGDIGHAIALRAGRPLYVNFSYYGGTITNAYGLYIEDQRDDIDGTTNAGTITNSYGVYQEGVTDVNIFKSNTNKFENLPTYADEAAAIVGGLTTGTIYKTATGELRIKL